MENGAGSAGQLKDNEIEYFLRGRHTLPKRKKARKDQREATRRRRRNVRQQDIFKL